MTTRRILLTGLLAVSLVGASVVTAQAQDGPANRALALIGMARLKRDTGDMAAARRYFEEAARLRALTNDERTEFFWITQNVDAEAALLLGRTILRGSPADHDVRDRMIGLAIDLDREDVVVALAEEGARVQPVTARWPRRLAESYLRQNEYDDAIGALGRVIAQPDATDVDRATHAAALEAVGRFAESAEAWRRVRADVRHSRTDWQRSHLHAIGKAQPTPATAEALEEWLKAHAGDAEMRALAGTVWVAAGQPARAVTVIEAGEGAPWLRQAMHLARANGHRERAIGIATRLVNSPGAELSDRDALAEMLIESRQYARAAGVLATLRAEDRCRNRFLTLVDRIPDANGTEALVQTLLHAQCNATTTWLARGIERAVAASAFNSALDLMQHLPASERSRPDMQALAGQLHVWTGDAPAAVPLLESALRSDHGNQPAREALVDALRALHRPQEAWTVAAPLRASTSLSPARLVTLGELALDVDDPDAALDLVTRATASAAPDTNAARRTVIERAERMIADRKSSEALARLTALVQAARPEGATEALALLGRVDSKHVSADLLVALAATFRAGGDTAMATRLARRSLDIDPRSPRAWFLLVDLTAADGISSLSDTLRHLSNTAPGEPALLIDVANRLSAFVRNGGGRFADMAIAWIDSVATTAGSGAAPLAVARARILAIDGRWPDALMSLAQVLERDPRYGQALKLQAEVLSWSGEHARAIEIFDAYLAEEPDDADARRQQARVAAWAGRNDLALSLYDALAVRVPNSPVVTAERAAKSAFLAGRWQAAADAYRQWIALEPENGEARFEYAQSLRAAGHAAQADAELKDLVRTSRHSMAFDAWALVQRDRKPGVALLFDSRTAAGYGGQRLLERQTEEGSFLATLGAHGSARVDVSAGRATLRGAGATRDGYHGLLRVSSALSSSTEFLARADVWDLWSGARPGVEAAMQLRTRLADRWTLAASADRSLLFENLDVVDGRFAATGATGVIRFESPSTGFEAGTGWHHLSDGNARWRSFASWSRTVNERWRGLRAIVWTEILSFRESAALYYSPDAQVRIDAGAQYTHDFRGARFRGDRVNAVTGSYLIGTDRDGVIYHHPAVRASFEFARGLSFDARADWIRSSVYNDRTITFGISIGGSGGVRR